ncbi:MAG: histidine phosphatase family protein [Deltaproteobacteria bacterium]|nr:histidine phosphatase family protein [Deltaproteobacteria bacterium]MBI4223762.1 histidine phosphatase family protein [Deltaproteobacteria bacterium]
MDLLLIRHGRTDWNEEPRVMGAKPIPLNEAGIAQARHLRDWLAQIEIHAVYSSPILRARQTAGIIAEGRGDLKVIDEPGVAEIDYGDWIGLSFSEVAEKYQKEYQTYLTHPSKMRVPGGEQVAKVQKRAVGAVEKMKKKHAGGRVAVVSHADVIKAILVHYLEIPLDAMQRVGCDNGSLAIFRFGTEWGDRLAALNYFADVNKIFPW